MTKCPKCEKEHPNHNSEDKNLKVEWMPSKEDENFGSLRITFKNLSKRGADINQQSIISAADFTVNNPNADALVQFGESGTKIVGKIEKKE